MSETTTKAKRAKRFACKNCGIFLDAHTTEDLRGCVKYWDEQQANRTAMAREAEQRKKLVEYLR